MGTIKRGLLLAVAVVALGLTFPATEAIARAGGGTSTSSGHTSTSSRSSGYGHVSTGYTDHSYYGGRRTYHHYDDDDDCDNCGSAQPWWVTALIVGGFFGIFLLLLFFSLRDRSRALMNPAQRNEKFLRKIARHDAYWGPDHLRERVAEVFYQVQEAWTERDQDLAKGAMSPRLYHKHRRQTDHMVAIGKRNVLEDIQLLDVEVVYIADRKGTQDDEFWAIVTGQMVDYETIVDWDRYALAAGALTPKMEAELRERVEADMPRNEIPRQFQELWKFVRDDADWVLDKIDHDLAYARSGPKPFSDEVAV